VDMIHVYVYTSEGDCSSSIAMWAVDTTLWCGLARASHELRVVVSNSWRGQMTVLKKESR
jgi:hypothetical protein